MSTKKQVSHIKLTSHPGQTKPIPIRWGAPTAAERGPVVGTLSDPQKRNVIGTHSGSYAVYRALAVAAKALDPEHKPDFTDTSPWHAIGPHPQWANENRIVSIDPFGATVHDAFSDYYDQGFDIRPSIAITKAHLQMPEIKEAIEAGRLEADGEILKEGGNCAVTKAAIEPCWFQTLMPDVLHWLGIRRIDRFVSMSNLKYDAIVSSGIEIGERVRIPPELVPADAQVEIDAKMAAGYYTDGELPDEGELGKPKGRSFG